MIPNHAPMAAVYLYSAGFGSATTCHFSLPVAAWNEDGEALVPSFLGRLRPASHVTGARFLGLWRHGWDPAQAEMSSLLADVDARVTLREDADH